MTAEIKTDIESLTGALLGIASPPPPNPPTTTTTQALAPIVETTALPNPHGNPPENKNPFQNGAQGPIIGLVLGVLIAVLVCLGLLHTFIKRHKKQKEGNDLERAEMDKGVRVAVVEPPPYLEKDPIVMVDNVNGGGGGDGKVSATTTIVDRDDEDEDAKEVVVGKVVEEEKKKERGNVRFEEPQQGGTGSRETSPTRSARKLV